jgi:hypothetical protein
MFLLVRAFSSLRLSQLLSPSIMWFLLSRSLLNLILGLLAWVIHRYLRHSAQRQKVRNYEF